MFADIINILTYARKVPIHINILDSDNCNPIRFQKSSSYSVLLRAFICVVLRAIKFYYKIQLSTVKICNVSAENLLA